MSQWVKVLASKPDGLCLIPRTHMMKERPDSHKLHSDFHKSALIHSYLPQHTDTKSINHSMNKQTVGVFFLSKVCKCVSNFSSVHEKRKIIIYKLQTCLCLNYQQTLGLKYKSRAEDRSQSVKHMLDKRENLNLMPITDI